MPRYLLADIDWLQEHGTSLSLTWSEDAWWEASWLSAGRRMTATARTLDEVIDNLRQQAARWAHGTA